MRAGTTSMHVGLLWSCQSSLLHAAGGRGSYFAEAAAAAAAAIPEAAWSDGEECQVGSAWTRPNDGNRLIGQMHVSPWFPAGVLSNIEQESVHGCGVHPCTAAVPYSSDSCYARASLSLHGYVRAGTSPAGPF